LNIWDVSGSELEDKVLPKYLYKSVDAFVLTFSLDNIYTLNSLKNWVKLTEKKNLILLKNKSDIKKISNETISKFKQEVLKNDITFENEYEANFKNFPSIRRLFYSIFEKLSEKNLIGLHSNSFMINNISMLSGSGHKKNCC
jgi:GTPase SAR1 family protein